MDLAQNAMIKVIEGIKQLEANSEGALIDWISKLVENEILDQVKFQNAQTRLCHCNYPSRSCDHCRKASRKAPINHRTTSPG